MSQHIVDTLGDDPDLEQLMVDGSIVRVHQHRASKNCARRRSHRKVYRRAKYPNACRSGCLCRCDSRDRCHACDSCEKASPSISTRATDKELSDAVTLRVSHDLAGYGRVLSYAIVTVVSATFYRKQISRLLYHQRPFTEAASTHLEVRG